MMSDKINVLKIAAFLHDLGKLLNWSGELHLLEGARVLKHLGFEDTVVGVALYHEPSEKHLNILHGLINDHTDCAGLGVYSDYDEYSLLLGETVDKLMAGFDRIGEEKRQQPVVLRNPLTHLPMNGEFRQFSATVKPKDGKEPDDAYLREFVWQRFLPNARLVPLEADATKQAYVLDDNLKETQLLQVLAAIKDKDFNTFYRALEQAQCHPPTDTLALWYHWQFSSAMAGLYWAEGFNTVAKIKAERACLGSKPLQVKIGLLYVRLAGVTEYFASAYRLPELDGMQVMARTLKVTIRERLLKTRCNETPIVWDDNFLYEGHDDILLMIPVAETAGDPPELEYVHGVAASDPFLRELRAALDTRAVLEDAVKNLLTNSRVRHWMIDPADRRAFGDGARLNEQLASLVSVEWATRCMAGFADGSDLRALFGVVWNQLRGEARSHLSLRPSGAHYFAGDVCDSCRQNLAGYDPDPARPREWQAVDWDRRIFRAETRSESGRPAYSRVFRSESETPGTGDKLCHACLLRRLLGRGTGLDEIAPEDEDEARIALIKGNVNRTAWYIGGSLNADAKLENKDSVYSLVWREEIAQRIFEGSQTQNGKMKDALQSLQRQIERAAGNGERIPLEPPDLLPLGLESVRWDDWIEFLQRRSSHDPFQDMQLAGKHFHPTQRRWQRMDDALRAIYRHPEVPDPNWLPEAQAVLQSQRLPRAWLDSLYSAYPNPWYPYSINAVLDDLVPWLFSGTPNFAKDNEDLPTPSRTMTVSWLIDGAVEQVKQVAKGEQAHVLYAEGDGFLVVCRAEDAAKLARRIFRRVVAHLNAVPEEKVEALDEFLPVTLAMGMVVAKRKHPMYGLLELVERLMRNAKTERPNRNAIDFENVVGGVDENYLDRVHLRADQLSRRPLTLHEFGVILDDLEELHQAKFAQSQAQAIAALMGDGPQSQEVRAERQTKALAYTYRPHPGAGWDQVRAACETGIFHDLLTQWRLPQSEEEENVETATTG
jgi:hypothetical protein